MKNGFLNKLYAIGWTSDTSSQEAEAQQFLIIMGSLMSMGGLLWGSIAVYYELYLPSAIPYGYTIATVLNFIFFSYHKNFRVARFFQVLMSLCLPFIFQWVLGGFVSSGSIMFWAMVALAGAMTFSRLKSSINWLIMYLCLVLLSSFMDGYFRDNYALDISPEVNTMFFGVNIGIASSLVFGLIFFFRSRLEKRELDLVVTHNELKATEEELRQNSEELQTINESLIQTNHTLKTTQQQLIQSEKMSSLGQMMAGIAHEINNPINFISAGTDSLAKLLEDFDSIIIAYEQLENSNSYEEFESRKEKLKQLKEALEYNELKEDVAGLLGDITQGGNRVTAIVRDLLHFSRAEDNAITKTDVHQLINATLTLLKNKMSSTIKITKNYNEGGLELSCFPSQLNQVFLNLLSNAIDAVEGSGKITITTHNADQHVIIQIADTGEGIPEQIKDRIFDPFFTTKPIGKGTGLGLPITYEIIKKHHGELHLESTKGNTVFTIEIPKDLDIRIQAD